MDFDDNLKVSRAFPNRRTSKSRGHLPPGHHHHHSQSPPPSDVISHELRLAAELARLLNQQTAISKSSCLPSMEDKYTTSNQSLDHLQANSNPVSELLVSLAKQFSNQSSPTGFTNCCANCVHSSFEPSKSNSSERRTSPMVRKLSSRRDLVLIVIDERRRDIDHG